MIWVLFNTQAEADEGSLTAYHYAKATSHIDEGQVSSAQSIDNQWWINIPSTIPTENLGGISTSVIHPSQIIPSVVRDSVVSVFDRINDVIMDFLVENTMAGITTTDSKVLADYLHDLWYYSKTTPTSAVQELDDILATPLANRAPGISDPSLYLSDSRINTFKTRMLDAIAGV